MVSLDIFVVNIIPLDSCYQVRVVAIDYTRSNDTIAEPLTKGLPRELVNQASKGIDLKPMKQKGIVKKNPT